MAFLKFAATRVHDGTVFLQGNPVVITDEKGSILDITGSEEAGGDIRQFEGTLCPGFVNCHVHLELSHMKGLIPERTGLVKFVTDVVNKRHFAEEEILSAIENAEEEMLTSGIVAAGDVCNNLLTLPQKSKRNLAYYNFIEASGYHPSIAALRFQRALELFKAYREIHPSSIVPHAPYSVSDELFSMIIDHQPQALQSIHNQESTAENEWFEKKQGDLQELYSALAIETGFFSAPGNTSLRSYAAKFNREQRVMLVHNVKTSEADVQFTRELPANFYWCLCPNANQYITGELPDVPMLVKNDCRIVLGTDSLASNHQLDILSEINTISRAFPELENERLLRWATRNGAELLGVDEKMGVFEKGKKPGLVLIDKSFTKASRVI